MDQSFPEDDCSLGSDWDAKDYLWHPYKMTAVKISGHDSRSKKRGRARVKGPISCQVENCKNNLKDLKEYHNRYRICKMHMTKESIERNGRLERFCQQCGRFHPLEEFEGSKRSCKVRLEKHNQRRRKRAKEQSKNPGSAKSSTLNYPNSPAASKIDMELEESLTENETDPTVVASSLFPPHDQTLLYPNYPRAAYGRDSQAYLNDSVYGTARTSKADVDAFQLMPASLAESFRTFVGPDPINAFRGVTHLPMHGLNMAQEMLLSPVDKGVPLTIPLANTIFSGNPLMDPVTFVLPNATPRSIPDSGIGGFPYLLQWSPQPYAVRTRSSDSESLALNGALGEVETSREMSTACYKNLLKLTSLSVKVFDCIPGNLPPVLRKELLIAVRGGMVSEGYMRPGCVNLTFDSFQPSCSEVSVDDAVAILLSSQISFWRQHDMMVQMGNCSRWVSAGKVQASCSLESNRDLYPVVKSVRPVCVLSAAPSHRFILRGDNLDPIENISVYCRTEGKFIDLSVEAFRHGESSSLSLFIGQKLTCGTLKIEVTKNGMIDRTLPVLCVDDSGVVAEIESLYGTSGHQSDDFLFELGLAFELRCWLHALHVKRWVDTSDMRAMFASPICSYQGRLRFRNASLEEFNCCIHSACRLFTYCREQRLTHTAHYLQPLVFLASQKQTVDRTMHGNLGIERPSEKKPVESFEKHIFPQDLADNNTVTCY